VEPVAALERIAYLLEASRAPAAKVRAFRRAAGTIGDLGADEVAALAAGGRLTTLEGIGDTTARVVTEALAGRVPTYLEELERAAPEQHAALEATDAGWSLRHLLVGDCHSHSLWSDGGATVRQMAEAARALGHRYLVMTDHSPRLTVAHGLDAERLRRQLEEIAALNEELAPFVILRGIEVDILEDGALDQDVELLAELDVVVASVHSKLRMDGGLMTERMLAAIESPHTDILGHCTGRLVEGRGRPPSAFDAPAVFEACARTRTAVEINSRPERQDPPEDLIDVALESGCLFAIDSDAHAPGQLEWQVLGADRAVARGVQPERIVNTWPIPALLDWTASRTLPAG
jgi:putative hydrolase